MYGFNRQRAPGTDAYSLLRYYSGYPAIWNAAGRTPVSAALASGEPTHVWIAAGQSMVCSSETGSTGDASNQYAASNAKVENFNAFDGSVYRAVAPLLGCDAGIAALSSPGVGGNWLIRLGDKMINANPTHRVIIVPIGVDALPIADWIDGGKAYPRIEQIARRLASVGLPTTGVIWSHGVTDNINGTSQAVYAARLAAVIARFRAVGIAAPLFVAQETYYMGSTSAGIRAAQSAAVNPGASIYAGPDTDALGSGYRQADNTHWNASGADTISSNWLSPIGTYAPPVMA